MKLTDSVIPSILVAPSGLLKPPFDESVVVLFGKKNNQIYGLIINRQVGINLTDLLDAPDSPDENLAKPVFFGGPSKKKSGFILYEHDKNAPLDKGFPLSDTVSVSQSLSLLKQAVSGKLPGRFELFLGCATWSISQLFGELSHGDWLHIPFCQDILFDVPTEEKWSYSFQSLGLQPYSFINVAGGAQA